MFLLHIWMQADSLYTINKYIFCQEASYNTPVRRKCHGWWNQILLSHQFPEPFEQDLSNKPYSISAVSKSRWKICVKWDAPNFLGGSLWNQLNITYSICWVQFYIFDHITKNCQRHNSFPVICHCKFPQSQSIFYFFGRSTDNSDIYVHVLILLKLINCYSKTAVAFLFVLLELKSFLFHSGFLGQFEFRWLVCFYKTAYNTTLIFLLEFIYSVPLLGKKQTSRTHSS